METKSDIKNLENLPLFQEFDLDEKPEDFEIPENIFVATIIHNILLTISQLIIPSFSHLKLEYSHKWLTLTNNLYDHMEALINNTHGDTDVALKEIVDTYSRLCKYFKKISRNIYPIAEKKETPVQINPEIDDQHYNEYTVAPTNPAELFNFSFTEIMELSRTSHHNNVIYREATEAMVSSIFKREIDFELVKITNDIREDIEEKMQVIVSTEIFHEYLSITPEDNMDSYIERFIEESEYREITNHIKMVHDFSYTEDEMNKEVYQSFLMQKIYDSTFDNFGNILDLCKKHNISLKSTPFIINFINDKTVNLSQVILTIRSKIDKLCELSDRYRKQFARLCIDKTQENGKVISIREN